MLDEIKIKLMTKVAIYEKKEADRDLRLSHYYKEDYIKFGCLKTMITSTVAYWLVLGVYIMLRYEKILEDLNDADYYKLMVKILLGWGLTLAVFFVYSFIVYAIKYQIARKGIVAYNKNLKKLLKLYDIREKEAKKVSHRKKTIDSVDGEFDDLSSEDNTGRTE